MKKQVLLLVLVLFALGIGIASAETFTGTLGSASINQTFYRTYGTGSGISSTFSNIYVNDVQFSSGLTTLVRFDNDDGVLTYPANSPSGNTTTFIGKIGSVVVCNGTFGYQRTFNTDNPPVETQG